MFDPITVVRDGVEFTCRESEEQVELFLSAGYSIKKAEEEAPKKAPRQRKKAV